MTDESIWSKAQPRGISRNLPRRKTGLASNTKKSYIKSKSHCLIFYQSIVGGLYTIISEGKFTQSNSKKLLEQNELSDKIKLKDFLGIQKFDTEKLREVIKVIRVHSQDEIEIEWNFDDIFSEQR